MKIKSIQFHEYKRFKNLTIDLGENPARIVALVGPNGCGKSCVFDGLLFHQNAYDTIGNTRQSDYRYHSLNRDPNYNFEKVSIEFTSGPFVSIRRAKELDGKANTIFSFRSPYRYNSNVNVNEIKAVSEISLNRYGASATNALDQKMEENYRRLQAKFNQYRDDNDVRPSEAKQHIIGELNNSLKDCLDLEIESLGIVDAGEGTLFFKKSDQTSKFEFNVLSSGEKEVVDILLDLYLRRETYDDTVFLIDEPELHINTAIQRKLLQEINSLVGENCQVWVATHSIGFMRALQEDFHDDCQIIEFGMETEFANEKIELNPIVKSRENWSRIFETALDDLTGLVSPKRIIYCEGRADTQNGEEKGLDARIYNAIFGETYNDTLFVSSGGNTEPSQRMQIAISILGKVFSGVEILVLVDRDSASGKETTKNVREIYLNNNPENYRMLERLEIENYLYDKEVLKKYCENNGLTFDETNYDTLIGEIDDCNVKDMTGQIKNLCGITTSISPDKFKLNLSKCIVPESTVYDELRKCIFQPT